LPGRDLTQRQAPHRHRQRLGARIRLGRPEDIAHMVMFLASDYADWITGQIVQVAGSP
jgi:NAD(P)-dependent dehydrogenase (short-subunit alcohol dehydrogenase family)